MKKPSPPESGESMQGCHMSRNGQGKIKLFSKVRERSGDFILSWGKLTLKKKSGKTEIITPLIQYQWRLEETFQVAVISVFFWKWMLLYPTFCIFLVRVIIFYQGKLVREF